MKVTCRVCKRRFHQITATHLRSHKMTVAQYRAHYPNAPMLSVDLYNQQCDQLHKVTSNPEWRSEHSERMRGSRNPFHGKKHSKAVRAIMSHEQKRLRAEGKITTPESFRLYLRTNGNADQNPDGAGGCKKRDRLKSLRRYGHTCAVCDFSEVVHNHHILGFSNSRRVEHMIILCPNHHALADLHKIDPEYLLELANEPKKKSR